MSLLFILCGPCQAKRYLRTCAWYTDSDSYRACANAHRAFALHYMFYSPMILLAGSEGPDQTARMRSLIWAFAVRICPMICFRMPRVHFCVFLTNSLQCLAWSACSIVETQLRVHFCNDMRKQSAHNCMVLCTIWQGRIQDDFLGCSIWSNYSTYSTYSERHAWANGVDPDQMPQNAASDQGLHCLPLIQQCYKYS